MAGIGDFARALFTFDHGKLVTGVRGAIQAQDFHRDAGASLFYRLAVFVQHCAHPAELGTSQHDIAPAQRT